MLQWGHVISLALFAKIIKFPRKDIHLNMEILTWRSLQMFVTIKPVGAQWLSGRVLDSRPKGRGFEPHRCHCVVSLSKNINPSLVLVQPRKTRPFITERLLMGRKESNETNKTIKPV